MTPEEQSVWGNGGNDRLCCLWHLMMVTHKGERKA